jgi:glycosyltransferase
MATQPLVTIITTALNCADTLEATIQSVLSQSYPNIEYIIVVSKSHDGTPDIIEKYKEEIDKIIFDQAKGIYSVLNSGLRTARGDIVGTLNSDDLYANKDVIGRVVNEFGRCNLDAVWGDLLYVSRKNTNRIIRYWRSSQPLLKDFKRGWMPPHPALFVRKNIFEKYGLYETGFKFASDYEMTLRLFYKNRIKGCYIPKVFIKMRQGGRGDRNLIAKTIEDYRIAKFYGLSAYSVLLKKVLKIVQFIIRPRNIRES